MGETEIIDDIWATEPMLHVRILAASNGARRIQICNCGMSGKCKPLAEATIENFRRQRIAKGFALNDGDTNERQG